MFRVRPVVEDALVAHPVQVQRDVLAMEDQLRQGPTDAEGVHEPVPREATGHEKVVEATGPLAEDHVPVEAVLVVQPRPRRLQRELAARPEAVVQGRGHRLVVVRLVDLEGLASRMVEVDQPHREALAVGMKGQSRCVLDEGQIGQVGGAFHIVLVAAHGLDG